VSEKKTDDQEKGRKSRSFGSFLLFLFVIILILVVVGNDTMRQVETLSQDEYLWHLYSGNVENQTLRGTAEGATVIEGTFRPRPGAEPAAFRTDFADAGSRQEEFRDVKARILLPIAPEALLAGIEQGFYVPRTATALTASRVVQETLPPPREEVQPQEGAAPEEAEGTPPARSMTPGPRREVRPAKRPHQEDGLVVEVVARGRGAWEGEGEPPFPLPERAGFAWLDVELGRDTDLPFLLGALETRGVRADRLLFELGPKRGTTFANSSSRLGTFLLMFAPWLLIFLVLMFFMRQVRGQGGAGGVMNFGRSRAQLYSKENRTNVSFSDVAGAREAKAEVSELVEFLKNPGRFQRVGGRIPRGVLLVGPPGCGKTLLAKAIAGEAEVPFFSISGSDFVEMFVGVGASRVRDLFKQARDSSPCIIFLDEIDAVGRRRGSGMGGGHDEREQTLNAILVEMDGFGTDEGIIVIAATNRPDVLDPALLRPGRFDREVTIDLPDVDDRAEILGVHLRKVKLAPGVDVGVLARSTPGYSGAELAAIVNEAAIMAALARREEISMEDLEEARDKVRYGRQKISRKMEESDKLITAYHEAGHAVIAACLPEADPPHKVTIVPRGRALGATMILPERESYHHQRKRLVAQLCMLFGGRVAEAEFCGDVSAGASDDIRRATDLARAMVTELGMSDKIGPIHYGERQGSDFLGTELMRGKNHSEETAREIDAEIKGMLTAAYECAVSIVRAHRPQLEAVAKALMLYETITGEEVKRLVAGIALDDLRPKPEAGGVPPAAAPSRPEAPRTKPRGVQEDLPGAPGLSPA
jgi:cell division protease FtsH